VLSVLVWFACLARGRAPHGMRDLFAYGLRYAAQTWGYLFLLTDRYPNSDPTEPPVPGARRGKRPDGREGWFLPDPDRPGRYLEVSLA